MKKLFLLLLITHTIQILSQQYNFKNYTTNDGLPSTEVYHVLQDSKGFVWFATDNGVSRFDGYEFKNFSVENGLPSNTIFEIYEDFEGKLWFISNSAQLSYYRNDSIYLYSYNMELNNCFKFTPLPVKRGFYIDSLKNIYWSDRYNNIIKISDSGKVTRDLNKTSMLLFNDHVFVNDNHLRRDTITIRHENKTYSPPINQNDIGHWRKYKIALKQEDNIFYAVSNRIYKISNNFSSADYIHVKGDILWLSYQDKILWIGTSQGLLGYENGNIFDQPKYTMFEDMNVTSILIDREHSVWITTRNNGVLLIQDINTEIVKPANNSGISSIAEGFNGIIFGQNNGAIGELVNRKHKYFPEFDLDEPTLINTTVSSISKSKKIVGTKGYSFIISGKIEKEKYVNSYRIEEIEKGSGFVFSKKSIIDSAGRIWLSGLVVVHQAEIKNDGIKLLDKTVSRNEIIYDILEYSEEELLLACKDGIWLANHKKNTFSRYGANYPELNTRISAIEWDNNKNLLIGTKERGLFIKKTDTLLHFNSEHGILNNNITSISQPNASGFWVGTKGGGLYRFLSKSEEYDIQVFLPAHGMLTNEINDIYVDDSAVFIATNQGLNIINHKNFNPNLTSPPIFIDKLTINNQITRIAHNYTLDYDENSFNITLTGLAYKLHGNIAYKYRLYDGKSDSSWIETNNRNIQLSYIPPGNYLFQAKTINENGIQSENPVEINFTIRPPYWKTWWFTTFIILSIILIVAAIFRIMYRIRLKEINKRNALEKEFIENKNKLQQEIEKFRQQALSQQMNPHFIFNSLNSIQYFIYQNEKTLSNKYLTKFSRLIRLILDNSQHTTIPIQDEFEALTLYLELEDMRLKGKLNFEITIEDSINTEFYRIPPLLIQPYVENSIWHGLVNKPDDGKVSIILKDEDSHFKCIVEDDGIGREKAREIQQRKNKTYKSLGTKITKRRLELFADNSYERIDVKYIDLKKDSESSGTRVEIIIPKITESL